MTRRRARDLRHVVALLLASLVAFRPAPSSGWRRIVTGIFGGVLGSIGMAVVTDLSFATQRGRVMGFVRTAFCAAPVLGLPVPRTFMPSCPRNVRGLHRK